MSRGSSREELQEVPSRRYQEFQLFVRKVTRPSPSPRPPPLGRGVTWPPLRPPLPPASPPYRWRWWASKMFSAEPPVSFKALSEALKVLVKNYINSSSNFNLTLRILSFLFSMNEFHFEQRFWKLICVINSRKTSVRGWEKQYLFKWWEWVKWA